MYAHLEIHLQFEDNQPLITEMYIGRLWWWWWGGGREVREGHTERQREIHRQTKTERVRETEKQTHTERFLTKHFLTGE